MSEPTPHATTTETAPGETPPGETAPLEPTALPGAVPPAPANRRGMGVMPVIYAAGFIVIVVALVWMWRHPNREGAAPPQQQAAAFAALHNQTQALAQQVQDLASRVAALEHRPAPAAPSAPDLGPLEARIATLEARKPASAPAPPAATQADPGLQAQVAALSARIDQLGRQQSDDGGLAQKVAALAAAQQSADAKLSGRVDALAQQAAATQHAAAQIASLSDRAERTARLQAASAALAAGEKLGPIPDAPPALARFADAPPPTEAALRLSFPAAAAAAERASRPDLRDKPFLTRLWLRAQLAVTVREDDRVIVGDPAAGIIARARRALDAGDLAGAVQVLGGLEGPAAQAMAGWLGQARALLAARAALAAMTTSG